MSEELWNQVNELILKKENERDKIYRKYSQFKKIFFCVHHQRFFSVRIKKYMDKDYGYLVCPGCCSFSIYLFNYLFSLFHYQKVLVEKKQDNLFVLKCQLMKEMC